KPRPRGDGVSRPPEAGEAGGARQRHAWLARADDESAQERRPQGVPARHQGRRAGLVGGDRRRARQAGHRGGGCACAARRWGGEAGGMQGVVGGITGSDVELAEASGAAIIGFNGRAHKAAREAAERTGTEIRYYNIIYDLVDDVKKAMAGLLTPTLRETTLG